MTVARWPRVWSPKPCGPKTLCMRNPAAFGRLVEKFIAVDGCHLSSGRCCHDFRWPVRQAARRNDFSRPCNDSSQTRSPAPICQWPIGTLPMPWCGRCLFVVGDVLAKRPVQAADADQLAATQAFTFHSAHPALCEGVQIRAADALRAGHNRRRHATSHHRLAKVLVFPAIWMALPP